MRQTASRRTQHLVRHPLGQEAASGCSIGSRGSSTLSSQFELNVLNASRAMGRDPRRPRGPLSRRPIWQWSSLSRAAARAARAQQACAHRRHRVATRPSLPSSSICEQKCAVVLCLCVP